MNTALNFPKVSILIPVFNRKHYITECIQSALDQTFTDFEIVVVDNASDDGTWEICQQFSALDQRVRIFRNATNIGPVLNWVRCAQEAPGEFSKFLFSDDVLEPNCLSLMVPKLIDLQVALVFCAARVGQSQSEAVIAFAHDETSKISTARFLKLVLSGHAPVSPGAVLIRTRDLLKNIRINFATSTARNFIKNGAGTDAMILLLTTEAYAYVANLSVPLVFFRAHAASLSFENINDDVAKNYQSAFSFYLIKNHGRQFWLDYLSHSWLQQIRFKKKWINPRLHLLEYEGKGTVIEVIYMYALAVKHMIITIGRIFKN